MMGGRAGPRDMEIERNIRGVVDWGSARRTGIVDPAENDGARTESTAVTPAQTKDKEGQKEGKMESSV